MIDDKDPRHKSGNDESADDEVIIDLTDEIIIKADDKKEDVLDLTEETAEDAADDEEKKEASEAEDDDKVIALEESAELDSKEDDAVFDLADRVPDDQNDREEDQLIASAIQEPLKDDEAEGDAAEEFKFADTEDDEVIIIDNARDTSVEGIGVTAAEETEEDQRNEDAFDLGKEIELEYEMDEDEEDLINLNDERAEGSPALVSAEIDEQEPTDRDEDEEPTEYFDLESMEQSDVIDLEPDLEDDMENLALVDDDVPEMVDSDELPDLEAVSELDFEDVEFADHSQIVDEEEADSSDEIIARAIGHSLGSDEDRDIFDAPAKVDLELEGESDLMALDDSRMDDEDISGLVDEDTLKFEDHEDLLDLDDGDDLATDEEVIPLDSFDNIKPEADEDIIEITEFDQHFPEDEEALLKQSGMLDATGEDEDDFLELIDIEEDGLSDDEEAIEFSDTPAESENNEINQFFSHGLEEETDVLKPESVFSDELEKNLLSEDVSDELGYNLLEEDVTGGLEEKMPEADKADKIDNLLLKKNDAVDTDHPLLDEEDDGLKFADSIESKPETEEAVTETIDEVSDEGTESTSEAESAFAEDEKFEFSYNPSDITQQVDRLDTFLSDEAADEPPEVAAFPADRIPEEEDSGQQHAKAEQDIDEMPPVPADQIDAAIERVINEKFSGRIENIIYEVIEKAVAKEIDRLKGVLMGNNTKIDDSED